MRQIYLVTVHVGELDGKEILRRLKARETPAYRIHSVDHSSVTIYSISDDENAILRDTAKLTDSEHTNYEVSKLTNSHFVVWLKDETDGDIRYSDKDHQLAGSLFNR
ncbi:hypothetical protein [Vibrio phage VP4B]|uniref:Uncharacterized protein n=1 Tax=Vibrio phage VP4B TaxID=1262540 RepID=V9M0C5_9CAUD|nr:hypothetical protein FDJ61_gp172 [Vibrio phage VP4B]AGB07286.1 hypothetical protein [Vibrio phage VP4B]